MNKTKNKTPIVRKLNYKVLRSFARVTKRLYQFTLFVERMEVFVKQYTQLLPKTGNGLKNRGTNEIRFIPAVVRTIKVLRSYYITKGPKFTVTLFKQMYNICCCEALGLPYTPLPFLKSDKGGFPSVLSPFKSWLRGSTWQKRLALTGLRLHPVIVLPADFNVDNIVGPSTAPASGAAHREQLLNFIGRVLKGVSLKKAFSEASNRPYNNLPLTQGPNGPTIGSASYDAIALKAQGLQLQMTEWLKLYARPFVEEFEKSVNWVPTKPKEVYIGKVAFLPESGGKTRIIGIIDFWSQLLLRPFHIALMSYLKKIEMDSAFNQNGGFRRILTFNKNSFTASYDLTAATDRFPLQPQLAVLKQLFGDELTEMWSKLIINRPFKYSHPGAATTTITWSVGQPLGAYASWALFSVTHHLVVAYCAYCSNPVKYNGLYSFRDYQMLGDDIVILDSAVAAVYVEVMGALGVDINHSKSFISPTNLSGEFTKRLFRNGEEISPIPFNQVLSSLDCHYNVINLADSLIHRWGLVSTLAERFITELPDFRGKTSDIRLIFSYREWINGGVAFPFCLFDRPSALEGLRRYILKGISDKVIVVTQGVRPEGTPEDVSATFLKAFKMEADNPSTLPQMIYDNWSDRAISKLMEAMYTPAFTFEADASTPPTSEMYDTIQQQLKLSFRAQNTLEEVGVELFFLKMKRRNTEVSVQFALKFFRELLKSKEQPLVLPAKQSDHHDFMLGQLFQGFLKSEM